MNSHWNSRARYKGNPSRRPLVSACVSVCVSVSVSVSVCVLNTQRALDAEADAERDCARLGMLPVLWVGELAGHKTGASFEAVGLTYFAPVPAIGSIVSTASKHVHVNSICPVEWANKSNKLVTGASSDIGQY